MRTTLDMDDDVLQAAKELAGRNKTFTGKILSIWSVKRYFVSRKGYNATGCLCSLASHRQV